MALINCPFCGKEISDKASKCIYCENDVANKEIMACPECGTSISLGSEVCSRCGFPVNQINETPASKKRISKGKIAGIIVLVIAISVLIVVLIGNHRLNYEIDTELAIEDMLYSAAEAEECCMLILDVWNNAIWSISDDETDPYTKKGGTFVSDFNEALDNLFEDEEFMDKIDSINVARQIATDDMQYLSGPPKGYDYLYEMFSEFYDTYMSFTNLAVSPTGSYNSYSEKFSEEQAALWDAGNEIITYYE